VKRSRCFGGTSPGRTTVKGEEADRVSYQVAEPRAMPDMCEKAAKSKATPETKRIKPQGASQNPETPSNETARRFTPGGFFFVGQSTRNSAIT
jgi:hypothetical protein